MYTHKTNSDGFKLVEKRQKRTRESYLASTKWRISPEHILDLLTRFILNAPKEELESVYRVWYHLETAWWFYLDYYFLDEKATNKDKNTAEQVTQTTHDNVMTTKPNCVEFAYQVLTSDESYKLWPPKSKNTKIKTTTETKSSVSTMEVSTNKYETALCKVGKGVTLAHSNAKMKCKPTDTIIQAKGIYDLHTLTPTQLYESYQTFLRSYKYKIPVAGCVIIREVQHSIPNVIIKKMDEEKEIVDVNVTEKHALEIEHEVLMIRTPNDPSLFSNNNNNNPKRFVWGFPKGKINKDEDLWDAARRELKEEVGWVPPNDYFLTNDQISILEDIDGKKSENNTAKEDNATSSSSSFHQHNNNNNNNNNSKYMTISKQRSTLFVAYIRLNQYDCLPTCFKPESSAEISEVKWMPLKKLPLKFSTTHLTQTTWAKLLVIASGFKDHTQ